MTTIMKVVMKPAVVNERQGRTRGARAKYTPFLQSLPETRRYPRLCSYLQTKGERELNRFSVRFDEVNDNARTG